MFICADLLSYIGNAYRHLSDYEAAVKSLYTCLEIVKQLGDQKGLVAILNNLGIVQVSVS